VFHIMKTKRRKPALKPELKELRRTTISKTVTVAPTPVTGQQAAKQVRRG